MTINVAINGFGRIGRCILRALFESKQNSDINIVAINDLGNVATLAHLLQYDTTHGRFNADVSHEGEYLIVNGKSIRVCSERDPAKLPWKTLSVDVVLECTGYFTSKEKASAHITAGAKKVIISAPGGNDVDATVVYGVNHEILKASDTIISNASCTTNCLAPVAKVLHQAVGIEHGIMNTIHAYTSDQMLLDGYHSDLRRARAAAHSMIPTKTGAASAVGLVLPELNGKLDGFAIRIPTINVSLVDFTFQAKRATTVDEINQIMQNAAANELKNILTINHASLVSCDFNHNPSSSVFDSTQTKVIGGTLVKVLSWYDNEWGFSNRMLDVTKAWMQAK